MPKKKDELGYHLELMLIRHEKLRWSNAIIDAPISYNLLERRAMYFLTGEVKRKFVEKGLGVPQNWKDLYFYLTDSDLGLIGGSKNVPRTYEVLSTMGEKFITVKYMDENGKEIIGKVHWVDAFFYDKETGQYAVRVSPEIMPYLINLNKNFTYFDSGAAMKLRSKYSQKMYELCCRFGGDYRHFDLKQQAQGLMYKKRVIPIAISDFRALFNLDEIRDPKTGKVLQPSVYENFKDVRRYILNPAMDELLTMFRYNASDVWFEYDTRDQKGKNGKVKSIVIYIYTRDNPKKGEQRPWQKGDDDLWPFECVPDAEADKRTPAQKLHASEFFGYDPQYQEAVVQALLNRYLNKKEVAYYMTRIRKVAKRFPDTFTQVIMVIQGKEKQPKFIKGTKQYKRNAIIDYVLKENLKEFGWSIDPPASRKERARDLIETV